MKSLSAIKFTQKIFITNRIIMILYLLFKNNIKSLKGKRNVIEISNYNLIPKLQNITFNIVGNDNTVIIGAGVHLNNTKIEIQGSHHQIIIEENCVIKGGCLWLQDDQCKIIIGKNTTINEAIIGASEPKSSVVIGEDCMLAHGIDIRCSDSHSVIDLTNNKRINYSKDIIINDHVWIAAYARILKGVNIGKNSIIALGSIVTKNIPDNSIAAGVPAKVKQINVTWLR